MTLTSNIPGTRTWGDGATDTRLHVIVDIRYDEGRIDCRCGAVLVSPPGDADALANAWTAHSGKQPFSATGFDARNPLVPEAPDLERMADAIDGIREMQAACTCNTGPIEDCPNYQPGDEEVDW